MSLGTLSGNDQIRLKDFMTASEDFLQRIQDEQESLKDLAKALAEELDVKPAVLMKAAKSAFKASHAKDKETLDDVETILAATGRI